MNNLDNSNHIIPFTRSLIGSIKIYIKQQILSTLKYYSTRERELKKKRRKLEGGLGDNSPTWMVNWIAQIKGLKIKYEINNIWMATV